MDSSRKQALRTNWNGNPYWTWVSPSAPSPRKVEWVVLRSCSVGKAEKRAAENVRCWVAPLGTLGKSSAHFPPWTRMISSTHSHSCPDTFSSSVCSAKQGCPAPEVNWQCDRSTVCPHTNTHKRTQAHRGSAQEMEGNAFFDLGSPVAAAACSANASSASAEAQMYLQLTGIRNWIVISHFDWAGSDVSDISAVLPNLLRITLCHQSK